MKKVILALAAVGLMAGNASGQAVTVDQATLAKMVQEEVARQLPEAVAKEIARQVAAYDSQNSMRQKGASVKSTLQTMRSQLELYAIQHLDQFPTLEAMADWSALTKKTDPQGIFRDNANEGIIYGPYIMRPVANPMNGKSAVTQAGNVGADAGWSYDAKTHAFKVVLTDEEAKAAGIAGRDYESPQKIASNE